MTDIVVTPPGTAFVAERTFRCALGRAGITPGKREGDGATPIGTYPLRRVFYRPDRVALPDTGLRIDALDPSDGWCDDPGDAAYNTLVRLPHDGRSETLWRADRVYDVIVVVGYNDDPVVAGLGSAIFMHVARPDFGPTEGCVAFTLPDLIAILAACGPASRIHIHTSDGHASGTAARTR
jgi:L,D-peptidoglycan transpeptidase YkuD (ErfK/YbiS/YcfS/YnhG family)